jgi:hypothetical protein
MSDRYGKEKFHLALIDLVAPGDIHSRVSSALSQHLLHITVDTDLPDSVKEDYVSFKDSLHIEKALNGHVTDVINNMNEVEVEKIAQQIVVLYEKVIIG